MKKLIALVPACLLAVAGIVPAAAARAHSVSDAVSGLDKQSLKTSMQGDLFEVQGGKIALQRTHNAAVVRLAKRLIKDHSKSYSDSSKLAHKLGVDVPKQPAPSMIWELKVVSTLHGRQFDQWYSSLEVFDHVQDIQEATDEVQDGTNSEVVDSAKTEIPMLKTHLALARAALKAS
jgi:putative membrane protein